ncbi:MEDS domain-containing protein [Candidatus Nitrosocosmicus sp. FF01]|uniref:MEDS domain-containing protein n=1 Tax=Candidatus Nitrosocosmicus sp. FF01 TaxID=3397670 RepID=UPI0039E7AC63
MEDAANVVSESDYGTHALIIYQDLQTLRDFYSHYVKKRIEEKNEIVHLASFYETVDSVRKTLSEGKASITDIEKREDKEKSLIIIDSLQKYAKYDSPDSDNNFNKELVNYANTIQKAGVSILTDTGAFPYNHREEDLVNYELALPSKYDVDLKRICLYHQNDFNKLSDDQKLKLLDHHILAFKI